MKEGCHHDGPCEHDEAESVYPSLYNYIDHDNVQCFNEKVVRSIQSILKPHHTRQDRSTYVESDCDDQLLVHIPFTGSVKLMSIGLSAGPEEAMPSHLKLFINRPDIDFGNVDTIQPVQEGALPREMGLFQFPTR